MVNDSVKVIKRSGIIVKFDSDKIYNAIISSMKSVNTIDEQLAKEITDNVVQNIDGVKELSVENIQDMVEEQLVKKQADIRVVREYITYRWQRREVREYKESLGITGDDGVKLTPNALALLEERYLKIINGKKETPAQMFMRTAKHIAAVEKRYGDSPSKWTKTFYNMLANGIFFPNIPCLVNANRDRMNYLNGCYILSVDDNMDSIFSTAKDMAFIFQSGGGVGINLSNLRPRNDMVKTTGKVSSGPVGFLPVYNACVDSVKQGGMRRGAALGELLISHPDIIEFINCKKEEGKFSNFNLSVALTDKFMTACFRDAEFALINPRNNEKVKTVRARYLLNLIAQNAWETGEPGIVFFDKCQANNPTPSLGYVWKNACAEVDAINGASCCLGSINVTKFIDNNNIAWNSLAKVIHNSIRFLDNVIDATDYPLQRVADVSRGLRSIGLGVMGFADLLYLLKIPYNSEQAVELAGKLMEFVYVTAKKASEQLAADRGVFPNHNISTYAEPIRNAYLTVIAPTGEISLLANCAAGIEPNFGLVFKRQTTLAVKELIAINPVFESIAKREGFYSEVLFDKIIANGGRAKGIKEIPEEWQRVFVTAMEISPEYHIKIQDSFQKHMDGSISKTVNMPNNATVADVEKIIKTAYEMNLHGVTVFRDGCRKQQVMNVSNNNCPECQTQLIFAEGCYRCPSCGWGRCSIG